MAEWFADLKDEFILNFIDDNRWKYLLDGLGNTLQITLFALILGVVIGIVIAVVRSTWDLNHENMRLYRAGQEYTVDLTVTELKH